MMKAPVLTRLLAAALVVTPALGQAAAAQDVTTPLAERMPDVIYVPTPQPVVEAMLRMANVKPGDVLYDLGSGDGRIPITAARLHGIQAVGIDIDPVRIGEARTNAKKARSEEHTSELQSLMRISYAVFCLKKKKKMTQHKKCKQTTKTYQHTNN